jgi:hypothetical protein
MIRRVSIALATVTGLCVALSSPAFAGPLPAANSGTITVFVPGSSGAASTGPKYQGRVAFNTTGAERLKNPRVWVSCSQNGVVVYGGGGSPSESLKLGGDSSQWVENGGGSASCTATLYYILNVKGTGEWNGNGAQGPDVMLATSAFAAAA